MAIGGKTFKYTPIIKILEVNMLIPFKKWIVFLIPKTAGIVFNPAFLSDFVSFRSKKIVFTITLE